MPYIRLLKPPFISQEGKKDGIGKKGGKGKKLWRVGVDCPRCNDIEVTTPYL